MKPGFPAGASAFQHFRDGQERAVRALESAGVHAQDRRQRDLAVRPIEAVNLGVLEYMVKPVTRDRLARVLRRATTGFRRTSLSTPRSRRGLREDVELPVARLSAEFADLDDNYE